jgi:hypothetical protein
MKKWTKRISVSAVVLVSMLIVLASVCVILLRGTPDWYQPLAMSDDDRAAAANSATNKIALLQQEAQRVRADERAATRNGKVPSTSTRPTNAITISFTDEEINALIEDWSRREDVRQVYERFLTDPRIVIRDGRVILAGKLKELSAITSLHFEPRIDPDGRMHLKLARVLAGKLPLPESLLNGYVDKLTAGLSRRMPLWRQQAQIDPTGLANNAAISAEMGQLAINALRDQPADPVIFIRQSLLESASIPVKVSEISTEDHTLKMIVQPMTPPERSELLKRIREGTMVEARVP